MFSQHTEYFYVNVYLWCAQTLSAFVEITQFHIPNDIHSFKQQMILR